MSADIDHVYYVDSGDQWSGSTVEGVFTTERAAQAWIDAQRYPDDYCITATPLNPPPVDRWAQFEVKVVDVSPEKKELIETVRECLKRAYPIDLLNDLYTDKD